MLLVSLPELNWAVSDQCRSCSSLLQSWEQTKLDAGGAPFLLEGFAQTSAHVYCRFSIFCGYCIQTLSARSYLRVLLSRDWAHRFLDYGLGSIQKRLEFVARRRR